MSSTDTVTVLLVDDEPELLDLYEVFLSERYDVRTATSGPEALEIVDESVDVALLDRRMPDMSGDEVLAEIRSRSLDIRTAMLTAVEPDVDIVDMPFDDYKVKPVDRDDLIGLVEVLSERATYDDQSQEFFSLASKKAALEVGDNDHTEEYAELKAELEERRKEIDATLDRVGAEAAFKDLPDGD
jgi:DNA-binding response OmpR family regulator